MIWSFEKYVGFLLAMGAAVSCVVVVIESVLSYI